MPILRDNREIPVRICRYSVPEGLSLGILHRILQELRKHTSQNEVKVMQMTTYERHFFQTLYILSCHCKVALLMQGTWS